MLSLVKTSKQHNQKCCIPQHCEMFLSALLFYNEKSCCNYIILLFGLINDNNEKTVLKDCH